MNRTTCPKGMVDTCCENYDNCTLSFYGKDAEIKRLNEGTRMTPEEIIEMACQAFGGLIKKEERDNFVAFAKLVAEHEREKCAKLMDEMAVKDNLTNYYKVAANAIRGQE